MECLAPATLVIFVHRKKLTARLNDKTAYRKQLLERVGSLRKSLYSISRLLRVTELQNLDFFSPSVA